MKKFMIGTTAAFVALLASSCADTPESLDLDDENIGTDSEAISSFYTPPCPPPPPQLPPLPPPPPKCLDTDYDGVCDYADFCLGTRIPEDVPTRGLLPNHYALINKDPVFDVYRPGNGSQPERFTIFDTRGCSCEQILYALGGRVGQYRHGCSYGTMKNWVRKVNAYY